MAPRKSLGEWCADIVGDYIASPNNSFNDVGEPAWETPIVGFSSGADPLYGFYRKDIGSFYVLPVEFFRAAHPSTQVRAEELTVISWVLPQTKATKYDQRKESRMPSERWARARIMGEGVNVKLRAHVVEALGKAGYPAVAPMLSPLWGQHMSEKYLFASSWSERHAAYAAGLGTFGLSDGLITAKGKAHRVGSVIAKIDIPPTPRPYTDHHAYCLWYAKGTCGACMKKCPAGAITTKGHDKQRCSDYVDTTHAFVEAHYHFKGYGCGFCQVGVPCESRIPEGIDAS
ncbi:MAG: epoxyqueuosine reductase [Candidatus Bathyarchaeota archaeon]|nr:epoxyqueuosine reductase [Candidatus Bathyarchaeota archaeon]